MPTSTSDLTGFVHTLARREGFEGVGICGANAIPLAAERLNDFVAAGHHGSMGWMAETASRRGDPSILWPEAKSAVLFALNYNAGLDPIARLANRDVGVISTYALGRDYHDIIKGKLKRLAQDFARASGDEVKVFVDTAPLMEKPLAQAAGLGWQGKHTNLVSRDLGSWFFLGAMLTTATLAYSMPHEDNCGNCRACLDACPTDAFPAPYMLDARRCISYLTIEHRGPIPTEFRKPMGNRIYGCDDCLAVCPWNKFAKLAGEAKLAARQERVSPALEDLAQLDDAGFRVLFQASAVKRVGRSRFIRNVLIALGNSGNNDAMAAVTPHLADPDPVVRGAAVWALSQLDLQRFEAERSTRATTETDPGVIAEWKGS